MTETPEKICDASYTHLSLICRYGRITFNDTTYYYDTVSDTAIREDVQKQAGWRVIYAGENGNHDEYASEPVLTKEQAVKFIKADRSGKECYLFGPHGIDIFSCHKDGKPVKIKRGAM